MTFPETTHFKLSKPDRTDREWAAAVNLNWDIIDAQLKLLTDAVVATTHYLGDPDTDDSWRIRVDGDDLVMERRESGTWNEKDRLTP